VYKLKELINLELVSFVKYNNLLNSISEPLNQAELVYPLTVHDPRLGSHMPMHNMTGHYLGETTGVVAQRNFMVDYVLSAFLDGNCH
jgi:hypothetical protein